MVVGDDGFMVVVAFLGGLLLDVMVHLHVAMDRIMPQI